MRFLESMEEVLASWGLALRPAGERGGLGTLHLFLEVPGGSRREVAQLWLENGEYVFEYSKGFRDDLDAIPILGFPDLHEQYRSKHLWPFFQARIPPVKREDVRALLEEADVGRGDTLRVLGTVSRRAIANPYEFEFRASA